MAVTPLSNHTLMLEDANSNIRRPFQSNLLFRVSPPRRCNKIVAKVGEGLCWGGSDDDARTARVQTFMARVTG
jgi:hypothetical protein